MAYSSIQRKKCKHEGCVYYPVTGLNGFCYQHADEKLIEKQASNRKASIKKSNAKKRERAKIVKLAAKSTIKKQIHRKPIAKVAKKRWAELKIYSVLRKDFLLENGKCKCGRNGCQRKANEIHHKKGRENGLLNVIEFWLPVNGVCHRWITDHPKESMELGLIISRLN